MNEIFQVPATLTKVSSMTHWWRLVFDTQETVAPEDMARVLDWINKLGWLTYSAHEIEAQDIVSLPPIRPEEKKSPAQRLYGVLYYLWQKDKRGHETFETFYLYMMERIINHYKEQLA